MVKQLRFGLPLNLPAFTYYWPITLAIIDNPSYIASLSGKEFGWRINAATVIAEASQQGAAPFLGNLQSSNRFLSLFKILVSLGAEAIWRIMSFIYRLFIRFSLRGNGASNDSGI
jgi:NADH dehydrogenase